MSWLSVWKGFFSFYLLSLTPSCISHHRLPKTQTSAVNINPIAFSEGSPHWACVQFNPFIYFIFPLLLAHDMDLWLHKHPKNEFVALVGREEESVVSARSLVLVLKLKSQLCSWSPGSPALRLSGSQSAVQLGGFNTGECHRHCD